MQTLQMNLFKFTKKASGSDARIIVKSARLCIKGRHYKYFLLHVIILLVFGNRAILCYIKATLCVCLFVFKFGGGDGDGRFTHCSASQSLISRSIAWSEKASGNHSICI